MSRVLLFLLGIAIGAAGVYALFRNGTLHGRGTRGDAGRSWNTARPRRRRPLPAPNGPVLPGAPRAVGERDCRTPSRCRWNRSCRRQRRTGDRRCGCERQRSAGAHDH
jgi:hypothetical protein